MDMASRYPWAIQLSDGRWFHGWGWAEGVETMVPKFGNITIVAAKWTRKKYAAKELARLRALDLHVHCVKWEV
jgi:hypothetical protein